MSAATADFVEQSAPAQSWREDAPALEEAWLENERRDAAMREWLSEREAEVASMACFI